VVSLLRRMIASEDAKNPLQVREKGSYTRIWLCYIRQKEGDDIGWSGEFAETQVQRPPDQHYGQIIVHIGWFVPPLERVERRDVTK